jgi:ankyrin repeat protein
MYQLNSKFQPHLLLCLCVFTSAAFAELPDHGSNEQILRAIHQTTDLLETSHKAWISSGPYCYTCHHEGLQFRVDRVAAEHGLPVDRSAENEHLRKTVGQIHYKGEPLFGEDATLRVIEFYDPAFFPGIVLTSLHDLGVPPSLPLEVMAQRLVKLQKPDGYWVTADRRPPQQVSPFSTTAYAIEAIKDYVPEQLTAEKNEVLSRARQWLLTNTPRDSEEKAMQLFGLKSAGASKKEIDPIAKLLIAEQRQDGGWAQLKTRESDAYATGEILVALNEAGELRTSDPAFRRGVDYLLKTQAADGSWHVKSRLWSVGELSPDPVDFKMPYGDDDVISYFGTTWADQALMLMLPRVSKPEKIYDATKFQKGLIDEEAQPAWVETALFGTTADLKNLLDNGLSANATTPGGTPVLLVVITDLDKVQLVLSRGADVNHRTANGFSALSVAANFRGGTDVVRLLLDHGARIERPEKDKKGNENLAVPLPLYLAAGAGEIKTVRLLIQHGEALDDVTEGKTALLFAIRKGDVQMVRLLIESGANIQGNDRQFAALQTAVLANYTDILSLLIEKGFDVNVRDKHGMTPLHYAAMTDYGDTEIVRKLLAAGANRDIKDEEGETPAQAAARRHLTQFAEVLGGTAGN